MDKATMQEAQEKDTIILACHCGSSLHWRESEGKSGIYSWLVTHEEHADRILHCITVYHPTLGHVYLYGRQLGDAIVRYTSPHWSTHLATYTMMRPFSNVQPVGDYTATPGVWGEVGHEGEGIGYHYNPVISAAKKGPTTFTIE